MTRSLYREQILEHYKHPRNQGTVENATGEAEVANPSCGDDLHITVRVEDGTVTDAGFEGEGCALSVAYASALTEQVQGRDVDGVKSLAAEDVFALLNLDRDEVSPMRHKCVLLAKQGIDEAIE